MPKVSIIIPTWNRENLIQNAIKSVQSQTIKNIEILVCDDGSTDDTELMIREMIKSDQRIKWIAGEHSGKPAVPRNNGIKKARGEWIAFLDSDDEWLPKKLKEQLKILKKTELKASATNSYRFIPYSEEKKIYSKYKKKKISFKEIIKKNIIITSSTIIHRTLLEKNFKFPEKNSLKAIEDYCLWLKISTQTDFAYLKEPLLIYIDDPKNSVRGLNTENDLIKRKHIFSYFFVWSIKNKIKINYITLTLKEIIINFRNITIFNLKKIKKIIKK